MSYYTVVTPCMVGKLHYATIPAQPIQADDAVAAALVASGALQPYPPRAATREVSAPKPEPKPVKKTPRRRTPTKG